MMKEKMKKYGKKLLAFVLTLAMMMQYWSGVTFQTKAATSAGGYRELTVSDWGITNSSYTNGAPYSLTDSSITTLDGAAFTAMITYNDAVGFRIGGCGANNVDNAWVGLEVRKESTNNADNTDEIQLSFLDWTVDTANPTENPLSTVTLSQAAAFKLRLTFDQDSEADQWYIGVWVNDVYQTTFTYQGMELGTKFLINGEGMNITDAKNYRELTVSDWGITNSSYTYGQTYSLTDTSITTLDGTAFTAMITYNDANGFRIGGGGANHPNSGDHGLYVYKKSTGSDNADEIQLRFCDFTADSADNLLSTVTLSQATAFKLRMTFDQDSANDQWYIGVWVNNVYQTTFTYQGMELGTWFKIDEAGMNITDVKGYHELTVSDWVYDGSYAHDTDYTADVCYDLKDTSMTTLDGTAFTAMITYNSAADFRIGGCGASYADNAWVGLGVHKESTNNADNTDEIQLSFSDWTVDTENPTKNLLSTVTLSQTAAFKLRLTFDQDSEADQWYIGVWVNDVYQTTFTYQGMELGTKFLINGAGMNITDAVRGYRELTVSDWALPVSHS